MEIFWRLLLAHLLADFTLQTDYINKAKRKSHLGMILHVSIHVIVSIIFIYDYLNVSWFKFLDFKIKGYLILVLLSFIHFIVDETRVYLVKNLNYRDNTFNFLADQFMHFYFIFLFSPILDIKKGLLISESWVVVVLMLVLVSHAATVFIYFIEKDLYSLDFPCFDQKYFMMVERILLFSFFLIPNKWWIFAMFIWMAQMFYVKYKRIIDISRVNLYLSAAIPVLCGVFYRYFFITIR